MHRTQIYLTESERSVLRTAARKLGKKQSELIRSALDRFLEDFRPKERLDLLRSGRGMWVGRRDLPDFGKIRRELDRGLTG
jgi:hypothetical protein